MSSFVQSFQHSLYSVFRRPSANLAAIDGIRALSMLGVLLYHCFYLCNYFLTPDQFKAFVQQTPWYFGWIWNLDYTVDAFFVISGYLIALLLFREHIQRGCINLQRFYWRRYLRLTPTYFAFIGLYLLISNRPEPYVWTNFLYVNNLISVDDMSMPWTWTLAVEEQFYLIFPIALSWFILGSRKPLFNLVMLLAVAIAISFSVTANSSQMWNSPYNEWLFEKSAFVYYFDYYYVNLYTRFGPFVAGAIAAYVTCYHAQTLEHFRSRTFFFNALSLLAFFTLIALLYSNPYQNEVTLLESRIHVALSRNVFGVALAWIMLVCLGSARWLEPLRRFLSWKIWYPFAQISYPMYLLHMPIVAAVLLNLMANLKHFGLLEVGKVFPYDWLLLAFLIALFICIPLSLLLCLLVERPFMRLRDALDKKQVNPSSSVAA